MPSLTPRSLRASIRALLHSWPSRLRNHLRSERVSRDVERELEFHLAERTDELLDKGMSAAEARYEARRRFGNRTVQAENTRERAVFSWLDSTVTDVRYALRTLRKSPAFAIVTILSLAIGIGANTAVFNVFNALLLKSLPVEHPEELVSVLRDNANQYTNPLWEAIRDEQEVFRAVTAFGRMEVNTSTTGEARRVHAHLVSGDYFRTLGVLPALGRTITRADDVRGCQGTAVVTDGYWKNELGSDPAAIGKTISLEGYPFVIVGILKPNFFGVTVGASPQMFLPICARNIFYGATSLDQRSSWFLQIIGRPKPELTHAQVRAGLALKARSIAEQSVPSNFTAEDTERFRRAGFEIEPASQGLSDLRSSYGKALYVMMTIVALVLLVACANVANLLLARATARQREIAVRLALGARKLRIARQLLTESLVLSAAGGALGVLLATWGAPFLVRLISRSDQVTSLDLSTDWRLLAFTVGASLLTGLLFGLAPVWQAARAGVHVALKANGRNVAEGQSRVSVPKLLVGAQVALSLVLVSAAGLLLASWKKLDTIDPGFRRESTLVVRTDLRRQRIPAEQRQPKVDQLLHELRALPGVTQAAVALNTYFDRSSRNDILVVNGFTPREQSDALAWVNLLSDKYFATVGVPLKAGRDFSTADVAGTPQVAIVSEAAARRYYRTTDVVGKTFRLEHGPTITEPYEIIGVAGDTRVRSLRDSAPPFVYFPRAQAEPNGQSLRFIIHAQSTGAVLSSVKRVLDRSIPQATLDFLTVEAELTESLRLMRAIARLSGFFGSVALVLAAIGLYGIMAYGVARRRNEIGVRLALGASQSRVMRMILGDVGRIVGAGVVTGVVLSFAVTKLVVSFLYEVKPNDPATLAGAVLVLFVVGLTAAAIPAWRAARLNPVSALREE